MPEQGTRRRARRAKRKGKSASTQAGEYVREEMHHARSGKHKVKNRKQAIAIGLSKARDVGVSVPRKKKSSRRSSVKTSSMQSKSKRKSTNRSRSGRRTRSTT